MSNFVRHAARTAVLSLALLLALSGPAGAKEFEDGEQAPEGEMVITVDDAGEPASSEGSGQPVADPDEDGVWDPADPAPVLEDDGAASIQPLGESGAEVQVQAGHVETLPTTGPSAGFALLAITALVATGCGAALAIASRRTT